MDSYKIYPKQFRSTKTPIEKNRCFFIMPFSKDFDFIYGSLKKEIIENGYTCYRADEIPGSKLGMNKIMNEILKAHYIVADLSGQSANVFYELGIAHSFKDSNNIILIAQNKANIPFDISHINHIIYDSENIKYLAASVIKYFKETTYLYGFQEALQQKNIINVIHSDEEGFVEYLQSGLGNQVTLSAAILGNIGDKIDEKELEEYFLRLNSIISDIIVNSRQGYLDGIMKILVESIVVCSNFRITERIIFDFLFGNLLVNNNLPDAEILSYRTDFAIKLASHRVSMSSAMGWLIEYFSRSKSATIDLNRYKIERFFMVTYDKIIDNLLIDALFNKNCYIREHLADIVGEKKLFEAGPALLRQLPVEENYFTAVSIVSAIGKLGAENGSMAIMDYLKEHANIIIKNNDLFVLKHCKIAIVRLDSKFNLNFTIEFDSLYGKYIENYFIL